jgi:hypothetical protein
MVHTVPAKIIQHEGPLPVRREMRIFDDLQSALLRLTGAQPAQGALRTRRGLEDTAGENEVDSLPAGAIGLENAGYYLQRRSVTDGSWKDMFFFRQARLPAAAELMLTG